MITKFDADLEEGIQQALKRAKEFSASFLVSETLEIDNTIEPYAFFARGQKTVLWRTLFLEKPFRDANVFRFGNLQAHSFAGGC